MGLILASASPRRAELLNILGVKFTKLPVDADESFDNNMTASETVIELSKRKALKAAAIDKGDNIIIACDTVVSLDGIIMGKPSSEDDAFSMLRALSGRTNEVWSGIAAVYHGRLVAESVCTKVRFRELSDEEIQRYIDSGEPFDKAGAYGIQGKASLFVTGIEGQYHNVVGFPV
ncbi:MAG: septum formation protein Maf, partial [Clostridia bacterium]|nr:septum formation protein Maf [Clostridia bacterium]